MAAVTGPDGDYSFADVADGLWQIQIEMLCFAPITREVAVAAGALPAQWELKMLPIEEMKTVTAAPVPPPTETASVSTAAPTPGLSPAPPPPSSAKAKPATNRAAASAAPPAANAQAGFQRTDVNESSGAGKIQAEDPGASATELTNSNSSLLVSGSTNNGAASPFAQSQAFGNMRKGPGWRYNGSVNVSMDNSALDARPFSLTGQPTPKPSFNHLQGSAQIGGPFFIPKLLPLRRTSPNFFFNYAWTRNRNASTPSGRMPTELERLGDFSRTFTPQGQPAVAIDPSTGQPFPGNSIPANRISEQAKSLLKLYPLPNFNADSRYNYQIPLVGTQNSDAIQYRMNKAINPKNPLNGSVSWQRSGGVTPTIFGFRDTNSSRGLNVGLNWMHRHTQRIFTNTGVTFSRFTSRLTPNFAGKENISGLAGITGNNQEPLNWGPPRLVFSSDISSLGDAQQSLNRNQTASVSSSTTWNYRSHTVTFGGDLRSQQFNQLSQQDPRGTFSFNDTSSGYDFARFLLGIPDTSSIAFGNADKYLRAKIYDLFAADDWRMRTGFTINAGIRWEYNAPITEKYGRLVNLDIAPGYSKVAPVVANQPTGPLTGQEYPSALVHPTKTGIEPRIGIAWHPILGSSMVIRGGYGIYYDTSLFNSIASRMAQQSPLSKSLSVSNSAAAPLTLANGFYAPPNIVTNTFAIDPYFRVGYSQNWQASIQRDIPGAMVLTATYLGIKGTRAQQQVLPNTYPDPRLNPCPTCPSGFFYLTSNGNSTRNAGTLQLRRRMHNGLTASVQYTFAKALDNAALGAQGQAGAMTAQNWLDLSAERGRSNFDQRHVVNIQGQYTTGMGIRGGALLSGWRGRAFKKWTVASQVTVGSGRPLTPIYLAAVQGTGASGSIRANYTGASVYDGPGGRALNPAAFSKPEGQWGNAGRNSITGPGQFSMNASMARSFGEGKVDFRLDATNVLNTVVYPNWNTNIQSAQFGLPTSANAMRVVQANIRVRIP
jgi:hypothetical protein